MVCFDVTSQAIRRGSFDSVRSLGRAINRYLAHWNETAKPFRWTKSARQIKRQIRRVMDICETGHWVHDIPVTMSRGEP